MPLIAGIRAAGAKPPHEASQAEKKNYAERLSNEIALVVAGTLRGLGLANCQPERARGRERQFAGGIGAKRVDVSFATEEDGLVLGVSIKSISFPDGRTRNYQKNLTNRRGDLLAEATTLHQRFPYAVIGGLFLFDEGAAADGTGRRPSTFETAHEYFRPFDGRGNQANSVERFEALGIVLYRAAEPFAYRYYVAGHPGTTEPLTSFFDRLLRRIAERNPDRFRFADGKLATRRLPAATDLPEGEEDAP